MRVGLISTLAAHASIALTTANAQSASFKTPAFPSRFTISVDGVMSQPKGEFSNNIGRGWGADLTGMFRLDEKGYLQLRADGGLVQYGNETKRIPLNPITGRITFEVETSNRIGWAGLGGQLQIPDGPFRPYVNAAVAYTDFSTESSLSGTDDSYDGLSTRNQHDGSHALIYGAGVNIPFGRKFTSGGLNFGARYYQGGRAAYLRKGDIIDNPDGTISFTPRRSRTDMVLWQLGASLTLPR